MNLTRHDVTMLIYNFAAVLSGGYAVSNFGLETRAATFGVSFVFAIVWTVYFKFSMVRRFVDHPKIVAAIEDEEG